MHEQLTEELTQQGRSALEGHELEAILTVALVTGMRRDELLHVRWQDVDLEKREVRVLHSKTKSSHRIIRIPEELTELLKQHRMRQMEAQLEVSISEPRLDLVFPDRASGLLRPDQLLKGWYALLEQAGLPQLRFHVSRAAHLRALHARVRTAREGAQDAQAE
ncbi:MAG TPA: tyrosine-type recombinase/integrase [Ktedonobacteraceae bacterium]